MESYLLFNNKRIFFCFLIGFFKIVFSNTGVFSHILYISSHYLNKKIKYDRKNIFSLFCIFKCTKCSFYLKIPVRAYTHKCELIYLQLFYIHKNIGAEVVSHLSLFTVLKFIQIIIMYISLFKFNYRLIVLTYNRKKRKISNFF